MWQRLGEGELWLDARGLVCQHFLSKAAFSSFYHVFEAEMGFIHLLGAIVRCCRAGLLSADTCAESWCQRWYTDSYKPLWPNGATGTSACLQCLHDEHCRDHQDHSSWCATSWAAEHCQSGLQGNTIDILLPRLTCCMSGYLTHAREKSFPVLL